jgi:MFS family permease
VYAGLPNLVDERDLTTANSLLQGVENVAWTVGPVLGGLIAAGFGPHTAYWLNAATFLFSALLVVRIPPRLLQSAAAVSEGHWRDVAAGWAFVRRTRPLLAVLVAWTIAMIGNGAIAVGEIFLAKDTFDAGDFGFGLLFGAIGLGLAVGSLAVPSLLATRSVGTVYGAALALMGLGFAGAAVAPNVWIAAVCCVVGGVGNGAAGVCNATLVQRGAPDELRGRAFTLIMSVNFVALGAAMAVAGPILDHVGPRWLWAGAGVSFAIAALFGRALAAGVRAEEPLDLVVDPLPDVDPALQRTKLGL